MTALSEYCGVCRSSNWCGRPCKMAPATEAAAHTAATIAAMAPKGPEKPAKAPRAKKPLSRKAALPLSMAILRRGLIVLPT
jgi:hypothetical protein